jgi:hypothetical protein
METDYGFMSTFMNSTFVQNEYFGKIRRELRPEQKTKIKRRMKI